MPDRTKAKQRRNTAKDKTEALNKSRNKIARRAVDKIEESESQLQKLRPAPQIKSTTEKPGGFKKEAEPRTSTSKIAALPNQEGAALASEAAAPKPKTNKIGCEEARIIITKYAFSSVAPTSCDGDIYNFTATRSGKPYTVKISSSNGELTEVKKVSSNSPAEIKSTGQ